MKIEELAKNFDPVTVIEFKDYILEHLSDLCSSKNSNSKIVCNYKIKKRVCEKCGSKLYKNGKTKNGVQKYICSFCKHTLSETTGTNRQSIKWF